MNIHEHQAKALLKEYGVPVAGGVERVIEVEFNKAEEEAFQKSVGAVAGLCEACINIAPALK